KYGFGDGEPRPKWPWLKYLLLICLVVVTLGWIGGRLFPPLGFGPPTEQRTPSPVSVTATVLYEDEEGKAVPLPARKALKKGNQYRILLEVEGDCFLYVLQVDSADATAWLFPSDAGSQPLSGGKYLIPDGWLTLNEVEGEEVVLVWAAAKPSPWLEKMQKKIRGSGNLHPSERRELRNEIEEYLQREQRERRGTLKRVIFQHD
ncbi:MAG: hypothetical protein ACRERD_00410, partial [Candidatus Binatia bacterium]